MSDNGDDIRQADLRRRFNQQAVDDTLRRIDTERRILARISYGIFAVLCVLVYLLWFHPFEPNRTGLYTASKEYII